MHDVFDNFVDHYYFKEILACLTSADFEWFYKDNITNKKTSGNYGFVHPLFIDKQWSPYSRYAGFLKPLILKIQSFLNAQRIIRARFDMVTKKTDNEHILEPHQDYRYSNFATILYINETDGDTILYKDKTCETEIARISPKPNSLLVFQGDEWHTGCLPIKYNRRILLNSNYV